jgi:hypothetical protein
MVTTVTPVPTETEGKTFTFKADDLTLDEWTLVHTIKLKMGVDLTNKDFLMNLVRFYHRERTGSTRKVF